MFALAESNSLVADLDIVVVDAGPHVIEGGSGDVAETDVTIPFTITLPFTVTITSPGISLARAAGEELNTRAISSPLRLGSTATPMPVNRGGWLNSWYSCALR